MFDRVKGTNLELRRNADFRLNGPSDPTPCRTLAAEGKSLSSL